MEKPASLTIFRLLSAYMGQSLEIYVRQDLENSKKELFVYAMFLMTHQLRNYLKI